ncbi:hypothetical protein LCGC14_0855400 [marine sediment metagenome]|uniref:Uncharacterized protein n=1 Tax=marine sediment metagenome TaxID=412755 RepID=A0A0F9PDV4_9ZZZZ
MFLRLIDKDGWRSPVLYIHSDEKQFMEEIEKWKKDLLEWVKNSTFRGTPLCRLDANTCIVDLLRHLTNYYTESTPNCEGRIIMTLRLFDNAYIDEGDVVIEIKTYE